MERINFDDLYTDADANTGEDIFYIDEELECPFSGIVEDYFKGVLSWEFEVKNGFRNGKERKFYDSGELMEENNVKYNTIDGVAREFYKNGKIKSISIVIRNTFIDTIFCDEEGRYLGRESIKEDDISYFLVADKIAEYREKYKLNLSILREERYFTC